MRQKSRQDADSKLLIPIKSMRASKLIGLPPHGWTRGTPREDLTQGFTGEGDRQTGSLVVKSLASSRAPALGKIVSSPSIKCDCKVVRL